MLDDSDWNTVMNPEATIGDLCAGADAWIYGAPVNYHGPRLPEHPGWWNR